MAEHFRKGLVDVGGRDCWAWLQPDGGWGWSNAGLIVDGSQSLLVDTLYDLKMTATMLAAMRDASPAARRIDVLVNSHADGDHTYGNQLVRGARIIASAASAAEFTKVPPEKIRRIVADAEVLGEGARYIAAWARGHGFDFTDVDLVAPTETYDRDATLRVGDKEVRLINVGPAHTAGDTLVHSVKDRVVFTADILFMGVHPAIWEGSIDGWLEACDLILSLDVDVIVPGHGPLMTKSDVRLFQRYLRHLRDESRLRFDAGMTVDAAAADIRFPEPFDRWLLPERVAGAVNFLYRQWGSADARSDFFGIFDLIARDAARRRSADMNGRTAGCGHVHSTVGS